MRPGKRFAVWWIALGAIHGGASSLVPLSSDEGAWLAIARRVAAGGVLYQDAIDNKSPFVFALVRLLDVLPGPFTLARAVSMGALAALLAAGACSIIARLGAPVPRARALGLLIGAAAVLQSVFVLTVELVAIAFVVAALRTVVSGWFLLAGALMATAALFDPRASVLVPGVVAVAAARGGKASGARAGIVAAGLLAVWAGVVLSLPDLRHALVELNLSSRGSSNPWDPALQVVVAARALLPVVAGFALAVGGWPRRSSPLWRSGVLLLLPAVVIAAISVHPFDHYWILVLPSLAILGATMPATPAPFAAAPGGTTSDLERRSLSNSLVAIILALAVTPALVHTVAHNADQARLVDRYRMAARSLRVRLGPGETFVQFAGQPFLGAFLPDRLDAPSPLLGYLTQPSSRRAAALRDLDTRVARAAAIVDDGGLSVPERAVLPPYRPAWRVFRAHMPGFSCARSFGTLTLRFRANRCP